VFLETLLEFLEVFSSFLSVFELLLKGFALQLLRDPLGSLPLHANTVKGLVRLHDHIPRGRLVRRRTSWGAFTALQASSSKEGMGLTKPSSFCRIAAGTALGSHACVALSSGPPEVL
jgi:hypothetical protein